MAKRRSPSTDQTSFNCPHCGSLAHQTWYLFYAKLMDKGETPFLWDGDVIDRIKKDINFDPQIREKWIAHAQKMQLGDPFIDRHEEGAYLNETIENFWASRCYSCSRVSLWVHGKLIYP